MASQPDLAQQLADLQTRLAAVEAQQQSAPAKPAPELPATTNLTFDQASRLLKDGKRVTRAGAPWNAGKSAFLADTGFLPHWGLVRQNGVPTPWPDAMMTQQVKVDLAARDWMLWEG
jgi:hypothetical protein